jgi:hypothetical protein
MQMLCTWEVFLSSLSLSQIAVVVVVDVSID